MKNLVYIMAAAAAAVLTASSCTYEIEDVFPEPSSERENAKVLECRDLLISAEHGWLVQYFPSSSQAYGGCTYVMDFSEDGNVTVASELASSAADTRTSHYSLTSSSSVILTFDTYNDYIHYWSDPDIFAENLYGGDFEFAYEHGDGSEMVFRGIKTGNSIVFTALTEDQDGEAIIQRIIDFKSRYNTEYDIVAGDNIPIASLSASDFAYGQLFNVLTYLPEGAEDWQAQKFPYSFNADGISLYEPLEVAGEIFQDFVFDADGNLVALDENGEERSVKISARRADGYIGYETFLGSYTLVYYNGSRTMDLVFDVGSYGESYSVSDIGGYTIEVGWTPYGYLTLNSQPLDSSGSVYLCVWALDPATGRGSLTAGTSYGFNLVPISTDPVALEFVDNGAWKPITSLLVYNLATEASGTQLPYLVGLVKNN